MHEAVTVKRLLATATLDDDDDDVTAKLKATPRTYNVSTQRCQREIEVKCYLFCLYYIAHFAFITEHRTFKV